MDYTIVYKTYKNDLLWLKYSLLSIKKYIIDLPEILIYYHIDCKLELESILSEFDLNIRIIPVEYDIHGYLKQMVIKCMCFEDINTDYIMIMDCDVIFKNNFSPTNIINDNGCINWYILKRNDLNKNDDVWAVWENSIINMIGEKMDTYYMYNGFPFLFKRETLINAHKMFIKKHNIDYNEFCKKHLNINDILVSDELTGINGKFPIISKIFEEFEYLGWYAFNYTKDYSFIEGYNLLDRNQYWSHGGITNDIETEIRKYLE
jgi:hypothetical protein